MNYYDLFFTARRQRRTDRLLRCSDILFLLSVVLQGTQLWLLASAAWLGALVFLMVQNHRSARRTGAVTCAYAVLGLLVLGFSVWRLFF